MYEKSPISSHLLNKNVYVGSVKRETEWLYGNYPQLLFLNVNYPQTRSIYRQKRQGCEAKFKYELLQQHRAVVDNPMIWPKN